MFKKITKYLTPLRNWKIPVILILGIFTGLGAYSVYLSKAWSYLSEDPKACINCHIMATQYATWNHSSQREVANCSDCHVPHDNSFNKYYFKAKDGLNHATLFTKRSEAVFVYTPQVELSDWEHRNEVWGENYPKEFQSYYQTEDTTFKSKYNGNALIDMLEVDPRLVVLWAGCGFSKDYNQGRGHYYAITDIHNTLRTGSPTGKDDGPMPTTCWTCKSPDVPRVMNDDGVAEFYSGKWARLGSEIVNPIGCADCHDPENMSLRISRPALIEAFERQDRIIENRDKLEELIVRAHVEAKFAWDKGATQEQMKDILMDIRHAQWRWDYAAASHGGSFHSPVETGRIISTGITIAQEGRIKLARLLAELGFNEEIPYPDISTKAKAQEFIGMDAKKLKSEKHKFLNTLRPQWLENAKEREDLWGIKSL